MVNQIRQRAFGDNNHNVASNLSGDALLDVIYKERQRELLCEGAVRWDMILSGQFTERTNAMRAEVKTMIAGLKANGYYTFQNGKTISKYIWTKMVHLDNPLTFDPDPSNPALFPGWRGQYDYSTVADVKAKVKGTDHNLAIKGLFEYIAPGSDEAKALEADGYTQVNWGEDVISEENGIFDRNLLSGLGTAGNAPRYYHPIPFETLTQSKGKVTNGYGLPQK